jgi:hypothetical protein
LTPLYMALIDPFRKRIAYPSFLLPPGLGELQISDFRSLSGDV